MLCGLATIAAMVVLLLPVNVQVHHDGTTQTVSCGMPLGGPRFHPSSDTARPAAHDDACVSALSERRIWALPVGVITFAIALAAASHFQRRSEEEGAGTSNAAAGRMGHRPLPR